MAKAIAYYEAALRVRTEQDFPAAWAMTQNNLGNVYANLPTDDRAANIAKAIPCYEAALRVHTEQDFPVEWAQTQNNLAIAYHNLPTGDRARIVSKAIACLEAAARGYLTAGLTEHAEEARQRAAELRAELSSPE